MIFTLVCRPASKSQTHLAHIYNNFTDMTKWSFPTFTWVVYIIHAKKKNTFGKPSNRASWATLVLQQLRRLSYTDKSTNEKSYQLRCRPVYQGLLQEAGGVPNVVTANISPVSNRPASLVNNSAYNPSTLENNSSGGYWWLLLLLLVSSAKAAIGV